MESYSHASGFRDSSVVVAAAVERSAGPLAGDWPAAEVGQSFELRAAASTVALVLQAAEAVAAHSRTAVAADFGLAVGSAAVVVASFSVGKRALDL